MVAIRAIRDAPHRKSERLIECVVGEVFVFINKPFHSPQLVDPATTGLKGGEAVGRSVLFTDSDLFLSLPAELIVYGRGTRRR